MFNLIETTMEISTTMVRFSYFKEAMEKKTEKAQLFLCGDRRNPEKVWIPLNKLEIKDDEERPGYNEVVMPKWLFMKSCLPFYTDPEEFIVTTEVKDV